MEMPRSMLQPLRGVISSLSLLITVYTPAPSNLFYPVGSWHCQEGHCSRASSHFLAAATRGTGQERARGARTIVTWDGAQSIPRGPFLGTFLPVCSKSRPTVPLSTQLQ